MDFRRRLFTTLRAIAPVLDGPGVMVVGSEVPNLLERDAAATLIVSQDVDVAVLVSHVDAVKQRLPQLGGLRPSAEEPSVWIPEHPDLLEVNFVGLDPETRDSGDTYVLEDPVLPLMVFGLLSLLRPGRHVTIEGATVPLPRLAGLLLEKLATERSGEKGDRDLLVALALILVASEADLAETDTQYRVLSPELRHAVRANLATLSLLDPRPALPDPRAHRERVAALRRRLERGDAGS